MSPSTLPSASFTPPNVLATVHVGHDPEYATYDRGNGYVYVDDQQSDEVSVLNGSVVVATVPVGLNPQLPAYDSSDG